MGEPEDVGDVGDIGDPDLGDPDLGLDMGMDAGCLIPATLTAIQSQIFGDDAQPHCNQAACHGQAAAGGISLVGTPAEVRAALLGDTQDPQSPQDKIVVPGEPENSRLYVIMTEIVPPGNGGVMPPNGLLPQCEIDTIRQWIVDGALEN